MSEPIPGSRPSPITPEDSREIAKRKAETATMTVVQFLAKCKAAGVVHVGVGFMSRGIQITLNSRESTVVEISPTAELFPLFAQIALEKFGDRNPIDELTKRFPVASVPELAKDLGFSDEKMKRIQSDFKEAHPAVKEAVRQVEDHAKGPGGENLQAAMKVSEKQAEEFLSIWTKKDPVAAMTAAKLAQEAASVDRTVPPAAGQGKRLPLSLPLCEVCKSQPVYRKGSPVCGPRCATIYYQNKARRQ